MSTREDTANGSAVRVTGVATVGIPVSGQDRVVERYLGVLGMEKRLKFQRRMGDRWVAVAPRETTGTTLALVAAHDCVPAKVETGIRLPASGDTARAQLLSPSVDGGDGLRWPGDAEPVCQHAQVNYR